MREFSWHQKNRAALLVFRLNKNPDQLDFDDVVEWGNIVLQFEDWDENALPRAIWPFILSECTETPKDLNQEQLKQFRVKLLEDVLNDPWELARMKLLAVCDEYNDPMNKEIMARLVGKHRGVDDNGEVQRIFERLRTLANRKAISLPLTGFIKEPATVQEEISATAHTDETEATIDKYPLLYTKCSLLERYSEISFEVAKFLIDRFKAHKPEQSDAEMIRIGIKAYDDFVWTEIEANGENEDLDEVITGFSLPFVRKPHRDETRQNRVFRERETMRWQLLSIVEQCRNNEEDILWLALETGGNIAEAAHMINCIQHVAEDCRIADPDPERKTGFYTTGNFIGNHNADKPKKWPEDDEPSSGASNFGLVPV